MEHWDAWCNLGGSLLGALGGLYLTYDLWGGKHGPLAGVTRVVTYMVLFAIPYSIGLGLKFGLMTSLGMGLILGYDFFKESSRIRHKGKPRRWITEVLLGSARALVLSVGVMSITTWTIAAFLFPIYAVFLSATYFLGWSPADNRRISKHILFRWVALWVSTLRGLGAGLSYWASFALLSGLPIQKIPFVSPWRVGLTIGGASFFVGCFSPWVEWWVERLSQRRLAVVGIAFAIIGFLIQAFPNWIVLLQN